MNAGLQTFSCGLNPDICSEVHHAGCADGATNAAIHSFTMASRHAYANTNIRLVEIVPPQVQSNLGGTEKGEPTNALQISL